MDQRIEKLSLWGCDIKGAMERMLNDESFYLECLQYVLDDPNFDHLCDALREGNVSTSFEYAHALKGVLANLGLTPMYNRVVEIVEPLRAGHAENLLPQAEELKQMRDLLAGMLQA